LPSSAPAELPDLSSTQRCLAAGHSVTALLRTPEKFSLHEKVHFIQGSPFDLASARQTIEGADVVLSPLGANSLKREDVLERAVPQIVAAMQQTASQPKPVRRIIVLGSAGALPSSLDKQPAWRRIDGDALPRNGNRITRADVADFNDAAN